MPISGICTIFDWGLRNAGKSAAMHTQADVVEHYGVRLNEELEYENVRVQFLDTRRLNLAEDAKRLAEVTPGFVPLFLSCDWHKSEHKNNGSVIEYNGDYSKVAAFLGFALKQWGETTAFGHKVSTVAAPGLSEFIRIKPFALNGPNAEDYLKRLDVLGEELGRAIGEYLRIKGEGLRR